MTFVSVIVYRYVSKIGAFRALADWGALLVPNGAWRRQTRLNVFVSVQSWQRIIKENSRCAKICQLPRTKLKQSNCICIPHLLTRVLDK